MKKKSILFALMFIIGFVFTMRVNASGNVSLTCNTSSNSNAATCRINLTLSDIGDTTPLDINYSTNDLDVNVSAKGENGTTCSSTKCTITNFQNGTIATLTITNPTGSSVKPTISISSDYGDDSKTFTLRGVTTTTTTTTKAKSSNNYLSSITIDGEEIDDFSKNTTRYFIEVENDVTKVSIDAEAEDDTAEVDIDGPNSLEVGDNEYTISVTSEDDTTKFYKVIVTRKDEEESSNTGIKRIKVRGYNFKFNKNSKTFYLNIDKEDTELDITVTLNDKNASYEIEGNENLKDGSVIRIIVTAEDNSSDTYRIIITKNDTNYTPIIIGVIALIVIIAIIVFIIIKKKKSKNNKDNKNNKGKKKEKESEVDKEDTEKTKEMPPLSSDTIDIAKENNQDESDEVDDDDDIIHIDNDEEEKTRILSYAEKEELKRLEELNKDDVDSKIDEELGKTMLFNNDDDDIN